MTNTSLLHFEISGWWLIPSLIIVGALLYFLYFMAKNPWKNSTSWTLSSIRFIGLIIIVLLLLNPFISLINNTRDNARVAILVDNSSSMLQHQDSITISHQVREINRALNNEGYEVDVYSLEGVDETLTFNSNRTDLSRALDNLFEEQKGQNLQQVILLSDGINNQGFSPAYKSFATPILTIGYGDTIPPKDLSVLEVRHNNLVYKDNQFPVRVYIKSQGFEEGETKLNVSTAGKILETKRIGISGDQVVEFLLNADLEGLNRYTINIEEVEGEEENSNNSYDFYVDVIEGKETVLIVAPSPHPDIRAIRQSLESNNNYETYLYIPGITELNREVAYDVAIFHSAFGRRFPDFELNEDIAKWYIMDPEGQMELATSKTGISIQRNGNQYDGVGASYNQSFSRFSLEEELLDRFISMPSLRVPYGEYATNGPAEVLLFQRVGSITTTRPLLSFYDDGNQKSALLTGTGIWKWKLQEAASEDSPELFDQLISKTIQYLSVKNDKRQFRVDPSRRVFNEGENVTFTIETYNSIYERTSGNEIEMVLRDENGNTSSYSYTSFSDRQEYSLGALESGIYNYTATTRINNSTLVENGEFLVKAIQLEKLDRIANHQLLKEIAENSGSDFHHYSELESIITTLEGLDLSGRIRTQQNFVPLINLLWILFIIISLFSVEWFFRKYLGSY